MTIILLLQSAVVAELASAGTYVMRNCNVPGHSNSPVYPWQETDDLVPNAQMVDACASGGGVGFSLGPNRDIGRGHGVGIHLRKPVGPRSQITFVKLRLWYATRLAGTGPPLVFWASDRRADGSWHAGLSDSPPGSENLVAEQQLSPDTEVTHVGVQCGFGAVVSPEPCVATHAVPLLIRGMEVTLREDVPPIVLHPGGTLLASGPQSGTRTIVYSASDPQSGLRKVQVLLDDTVVASQDLASRCSYSDFTVCPDILDETLHVDTRAVADGRYRLTLRVGDAAGNDRVVDGGRLVEVANGSIPGSTDDSEFTIIAKFNGTSRSTLTVPYGRRVSVRGRLMHQAQAMAGTRIELLERPDSGTREKATRRVETNADGSFSMVLGTRRPSRTVRLAYRPNGGAQIVSRRLRLRVRSASRLRASLRGRLIRFSGSVLSGPIAKRGKRILMEGRSPGSAWTVFKRLRTDRNGRFSGTYRLRVRRPGVLLKVRALVPRENGYGYLGSRSRAVSLRVR